MAQKTNDLIQVLKKQNIESLFFIDVGAKEVLDFCPDLASITNIIGFEPNPKEFESLVNKYIRHSFKSLKLEPLCLSDIDGKIDFHITKHSSMSSLLPSDPENYRKHFGHYQQFEKWKDNIITEKTLSIDSVQLDNYFHQPVPVIDFLKIDTQGSELKILHGAEKLLDGKRINMLKIEVSTIPVYKGQVLFSDIDIFLRGKGYTLVDFITYRENYQPVFGRPHHKQQHYAACGDAIYILDSEFLTSENKIKSATLLLWLGYYSLSAHLLQNSLLTKNDQKTISAFLFTQPKSTIKQLFVNLCPPLFLYWLKKKA